MNNPFPGMGLPPNLVPNPPGEIPEAPGPGDATANMSPFTEPQDVASIIKNLVLDRPLKLYIPPELMHPDYNYRIINGIPHEIAAAHNKGWQEATNPEVAALFTALVAGTDKDGKSFRPILMARPKVVSEHIAKQHRMQLRSMYAGMDPVNKEFTSKYAKNIKAGPDASAAEFEGRHWRIRV